MSTRMHGPGGDRPQERLQPSEGDSADVAPPASWWTHDRIYYEIDMYVIASVVLMIGSVIAVPLIVASQDGVLLHDAMKPRNLRHYHHLLPPERPLMREKLEAERAELLEQLAKV